jgi:hypothetical protein
VGGAPKRSRHSAAFGVTRLASLASAHMNLEAQDVLLSPGMTRDFLSLDPIKSGSRGIMRPFSSRGLLSMRRPHSARPCTRSQ